MKVLVSAGEVSGDLYGSFLIKELSRLKPGAVFLGMGGERLANAGADIRLDIIDRSSVGLVETLPNLVPIYLTFRKMVSFLEKEKPDLVLAIDSQGFNVPLLKEAKKRGIRTAYYIPPQEWLWGSLGNLKKVIAASDLLLCIFEEECRVYRQEGGNAVYFGHPILDIVETSIAKDAFLAKHSLKNVFPIISLGLGSRKQEFKTLLPKVLRTAELVAMEFKNAQFLLPLSDPRFKRLIEPHLRAYSINARIIKDSTYNILNSSDFLITKSGTINVEACVLNVPNIMMYEVSPLTYWLAEKVLKIRVPQFFSLPNIIAKEKIIPEFVQRQAVPEEMAKITIEIIKNPQHLKILMQKVTAALGSFGATAKIAEAIVKML